MSDYITKEYDKEALNALYKKEAAGHELTSDEKAHKWRLEEDQRSYEQWKGLHDARKAEGKTPEPGKATAPRPFEAKKPEPDPTKGYDPSWKNNPRTTGQSSRKPDGKNGK